MDVFSGRYAIQTHRQPEIIMDDEHTTNKSLLPKVDIDDNHVTIARQPLTQLFASQRSVDFKLMIPEHATLTVKLFAGDVAVSGVYKKLNVRVRSGNVMLDGPLFEYSEPSQVRVLSGSLICRGLTDAGYALPWLNDKVHYIENADGVPLRVQVYLGEVDFS